MLGCDGIHGIGNNNGDVSHKFPLKVQGCSSYHETTIKVTGLEFTELEHLILKWTMSILPFFQLDFLAYLSLRRADQSPI